MTWSTGNCGFNHIYWRYHQGETSLFLCSICLQRRGLDPQETFTSLVIAFNYCLDLDICGDKKIASFIITTYFSKSKEGFFLFFFLFYASLNFESFVTIVLVLGSTWNEENQFPDSGPSPSWTRLHRRENKIPNHCFCKEEPKFPWTMGIHGSCKL